ncbi:acyltransferase family protein [Aquabacterium sp.]|uniref:acyltransferase family protein n=1 Tax=Aquabacterium sp. TaxID=1872578 RepID=UPI0037834666
MHQDPALPPRRFDLDWLRILAFGLLILYHVGMYYVSWDWHVKSPFASATLEPLMLASSPWRLSLLFFVSGVATAYLLRRQPTGFVASRARRLLVPLLFGMLVIVVPQAYYEVVEKAGYADGYLAFWQRYLLADPHFCRGNDCLRVPTWNHLWFVPYLFVYSLLLWALQRTAPQGWLRLCDGLARRLSGWGLLLWPVLLLALWRVLLVARFPATHDLVQDWYNHAQYLSMFGLGAALAFQSAPWAALARWRWWALAGAVASYAFIAWYFTVYAVGRAEVPDALRMCQRLIYAANQWWTIAAALGFARRWAPTDSPLRRYLTEAVFPFYIVHQSAIIVLAEQLKPLRLPPAVEGPLLVLATAAVCGASFEAMRRVRWLRPLFGLAPQPALAATADRRRPASIASP